MGDTVYYGPDNVALTKEEADFFNEAAGELAISDEEDDVNIDEDLDRSAERDGYSHEVEPEVAEQPRYVYRSEDVPEEILREYRRRVAGNFKPDGAGDRLPGTQ